MNRMRLLVLFIALVSRLVSTERAVHAASPDEAPLVGLFDTLRPLAGIVFSETMQTRQGWEQVPEEKVDHRFQGDVVLRNRRIAVVLRKDTPGAEVYSHSPKGWNRQAVLVPCGVEKAKRLLSVTAVANDGGEVAVEAAFLAADGRTVGLVCWLRIGGAFVRTEPRGDTTRLDVEAASRFGAIPDFYADDIILDATKIHVPKTHIPSENMFAQLLGDNETLAICLWDGPPQDIEIILAESGDARVISGTEIRYAKQGRIYLGLLDFSSACYVGVLDKLPDRTGPIAGYKLERPVKRLDWQMPFPAQWRVDFVTESTDAKLVRSREMSAPYPYPVKDGKCQGFRFIKPSYVWDWGGGTDTEMSGTPDKYPSWVDFEGHGFVRPVGESYAVIVYPFDRGRGTPLEAITLTDLVRQTLGVGPCRYILDADRRMTQTPGIFTCGGTDMLKKLEGPMSQHKAEVEKLLNDMLIFVTAYRRRIDQYIAFRRELIAYLETQEERHPDNRSFIGRMKSLVDAIPSEMTRDFPKLIEQLNAEYRATLNSNEEAAKKTRDQLHRRYTSAGGAQDGILAKCHQAAKLLRYEAGMTLSADPTVAEIAVEVRKRASAVLQNPAYHETKDRHRMDRG